MLLRSLLGSVLLGGCTQAALPAPATPSEPPVAVERAGAPAPSAHQRRVARLSPPFASENGTRRVAGTSEVTTALVTAP